MADVAAATRRGPQQFFDRLATDFESAAEVGLISRSVRFGTDEVEIRFAGSALVGGIMPALRHQEAGPVSSPDLTIDIFDTTTTGVSPGPPPWGPYDYLARGEIRGYNRDAYRTSYRVDAGILTMVNLRAGHALFWIRDRSLYPDWMRAAPLRNVFGWWATYRGLQLVHGAAVGAGRSAILLSAPSGSGKSTTAVRAALEGMAFLGDDYVLIDPHRLRVYSIYGSAKMDETSIRRFVPEALGRSRGLVGEPPKQKHFFLGQDVFPTSVNCDYRLTGLVIPSVEGGDTTVRTEISRAEALAAVAPTTLFQLEGSSGDDFASLASLVRRLPILGLKLGRGPVAPILTAFLEETAR